MRKKIVAGNWKMNLQYDEALELINEITDLTFGLNDENISIVIAPAFPYLKDAAELVLSFSHLSIAAQNCANKDKGAFTGEVSVSMLQSIGVEYVIIGHSERRLYYGETNETVKQKIDLALSNNIKPIVCVGESLDERNTTKHFEIVKSQITECTKHLSPEQFVNVIIAYEPVWAIGTGLTATPAQAQEMHSFIRETISNNNGVAVANNCSILYGGSCNENNAKELFTCMDIDGGLIGGASIKVDSFYSIICALR